MGPHDAMAHFVGLDVSVKETAVSYIGDNLPTKRIVDPANTNNVISDDLSAAEKSAVAAQAKTSAGKQYWKDIIW